MLMLCVSVGVGASAATLDDVRGRDRLICGVSEGLRGFSEQDQTGIWRGFDVDFCRAVAAAALGDHDKVDFVPLSARDEVHREARSDALLCEPDEMLALVSDRTWDLPVRQFALDDPPSLARFLVDWVPNSTPPRGRVAAPERSVQMTGMAVPRVVS